MYDHLIIGAGPAGLQMEVLLKKNGWSYLIWVQFLSPHAYNCKEKEGFEH